MFSLYSVRFGLRLLTVLSAAAMASPAAPVEIIPAELYGAIQPQVAAAPDGRIHITFGKGEAIYHVASSDSGRTFSKPVQVGELPKLALGMRRGPRITATDKVVVITAISHEEGDLHAWTSSDGGATWTASANVNDRPKSAREGLHAMAGDGKGNVFVTWLDLRNKGTELWSATSGDGGATWSPNAPVYKSPDGHICECCHPSVAIDQRGRIAVMFRNWLAGSRDMYLSMSGDGGKTFGLAQKLGLGTWKLNGCPMDGGALAFDSAGELHTTWRREKTVFATGPSDVERRLADSALQSVTFARKNDSFYLWESDGGLMLKKNASSPGRFAEKAMFAAGAPLPNGKAILVWQSEADGAKTLLAQLLD
jgi:hypothetical protein